MNTERDRPNILFLLTDMQRYDALGFNGNTVCKTPAIDRIAREGMRFCRAYTPIALCSPARGSLLTGMFPHNHGQLSNMGNFNRAFDLNILDKAAYPQILSARVIMSVMWVSGICPGRAMANFGGLNGIRRVIGTRVCAMRVLIGGMHRKFSAWNGGVTRLFAVGRSCLPSICRSTGLPIGRLI